MTYLFLYIIVYFFIYFTVAVKVIDSPFATPDKLGIAIISAFLWLPGAMIIYYFL